MQILYVCIKDKVFCSSCFTSASLEISTALFGEWRGFLGQWLYNIYSLTPSYSYSHIYNFQIKIISYINSDNSHFYLLRYGTRATLLLLLLFIKKIIFTFLCVCNPIKQKLKRSWHLHSPTLTQPWIYFLISSYSLHKHRMYNVT
jgi:hypothetical protein